MNTTSNKSIQESNLEHKALDFDYGELPAKQVKYLKRSTGELKKLVEKASSQLIEIGQKLIQVKERVGHGHFIAWLDVEFGWDRSTAWKMMQVSEKCFKFKELNIQRSALYLLSSKSFSDEERDDFARRAEAGEVITHKTLKSVLLLKQDTLEASKTLEAPIPKEVLRLAMDLLGKIDLSPCSHGASIPVRTHFSPGDDPLKAPWKGKVLLHPASEKSIASYVAKLNQDYKGKNLTEALAYLPIKIDAAWFRSLRSYPRCFIKECEPAQPASKGTAPMMVVYLGNNNEGFIDLFKVLGDCYECVGLGADYKIIDLPSQQRWGSRRIL